MINVRNSKHWKTASWKRWWKKRFLQGRFGIIDKKPSTSSEIDIYKFEKTYIPPAYCGYFGCGKILTHEEKLFGNTCCNHNKKQSSLDVIDKHISL